MACECTYEENKRYILNHITSHIDLLLEKNEEDNLLISYHFGRKICRCKSSFLIPIKTRKMIQDELKEYYLAKGLKISSIAEKISSIAEKRIFIDIKCNLDVMIEKIKK